MDYISLFYDLKAKAEKKRKGESAQKVQVIGDFAYQFYLKTRPNPAKKLCLEIGVGSGWAMHSMLNGGAAHVHGIDVSQERLDEANELLATTRHVNFTLKRDSAEVLESCQDKHFDYVNFLDVLEHLPNPMASIAAIRQVLKPGGHVYCKTPNQFTDHDLRLHHVVQESMARLLSGIIPFPGGNEKMLLDDFERLTAEEQEALRTSIPEDFHEHMRQFYPDELIKAFTDNGFEIVGLHGTPLFVDMLFIFQNSLPALANLWLEWVSGTSYHRTIEAIFEDMLQAPGYQKYRDLPPDYVISDNLVLVGRKI